MSVNSSPRRQKTSSMSFIEVLAGTRISPPSVLKRKTSAHIDVLAAQENIRRQGSINCGEERTVGSLFGRRLDSIKEKVKAHFHKSAKNTNESVSSQAMDDEKERLVATPVSGGGMRTLKKKASALFGR